MFQHVTLVKYIPPFHFRFVIFLLKYFVSTLVINNKKISIRDDDSIKWMLLLITKIFRVQNSFNEQDKSNKQVCRSRPSTDKRFKGLIQ